MQDADVRGEVECEGKRGGEEDEGDVGEEADRDVGRKRGKGLVPRLCDMLATRTVRWRREYVLRWHCAGTWLG